MNSLFARILIVLLFPLNSIAQTCDYIYVATWGSNTNPGTETAPVANLYTAMSLVSGTRRNIRIAEGTYNEPFIVNLLDDVDIEGGYVITAGEWVKHSDVLNTIIVGNGYENAATNVRHRVTIKGTNVQGWSIRDLYIRTNSSVGNINGFGLSNYGIILLNCSAYSIVRCRIESGNATAGTNGNAGFTGANGSSGQAGYAGNCSDGANPGHGGNGGWGGGGTGGGIGGLDPNGGGCCTIPNPGTQGNTPTAWRNGSGGGGGGCGGEEYTGTYDGRGSAGGAGGNGGGAGGAFGYGADPGTAGGNGLGGASGSWGANGTIGALGFFNSYFFVPGTQGGTGQDGQGGRGGGGGGGGGGQNVALSTTEGAGNGGGGGGGGGQGGTGGTGGRGGGSSVALLRANSLTAALIDDCIFVNGTYGVGGTGGIGGNGGAGGPGGFGATTCLADVGRGGNGGNGGAGGRGGNGGNGRPGYAYPSYTVGGSWSDPSTGFSTAPAITAQYSGCTNSEIVITKASGTWALSGLTFIPDLNISTTSYNASSATAIVSTPAIGFHNINNGSDFPSFIKITTNRPLPQFDPSMPAQVCEGEDFTMSTPTTGDEYEWVIFSQSGYTTSPIATFTTQNATWTTPITGFGALYSVRLRVRTDCCGWSVPVYFNFAKVVMNLSSTGMTAGDYTWNGVNSNDWTTASNWSVWNGTTFATAATPPSATTNVFISPLGQCQNFIASTLNNTCNANSVTINNGGELVLGNGSMLNIDEHWTNNSGNVANVTADNNSTVRFYDGTSFVDIIQGNTSTHFGNLTTDLMGYLDVYTETTVKNTLDMHSNIWLHDRLILGISPTQPGTLVHDMTPMDGWITGPSYFRRYFAQGTNSGITGYFPFGAMPSIFYRPATIEYTTAPTSGGWIEGRFSETQLTLSNGLPILNDSGVDIWNYMDEGFWEMIPGGGLAGGNYTIKLRYDGIQTINDASLLRIIKAPDPHTTWVADGVHGGLEAPNTVTRNGLSGYSWFVISSSNLNPLPSDLLNLSVSCETFGRSIYWTAMTQPNSATYQVERQLENGEWLQVASLEALQSTTSSDYVLYDDFRSTETVVYRLIETDMNGASKVLGQLSSSCENEDEISVYPNPTSGVLNISLTSKMEDQLIISILDQFGRTVYRDERELQSGSNLITLHPALLPGSYIVNCSTHFGERRMMVVVE